MEAKQLEFYYGQIKRNHENGLFLLRYGPGVAHFKSWMQKPSLQEFSKIMGPILEAYEAKILKD